MEDGIAAVLLTVFVIIAFLVLAPLGAVIGAAAGWIVSGIFPSVTDRLCAMLGVDHAYQVGAMLGFVGGFFSSIHSAKD